MCDKGIEMVPIMNRMFRYKLLLFLYRTITEGNLHALEYEQECQKEQTAKCIYISNY